MTPNQKLAKELIDWLGDGDETHPYGALLKRFASELDEAERRAYRSLARWASKTATAVERAPVKWHWADEHYAKVDALRDVAAECRRRAKGNA